MSGLVDVLVIGAVAVAVVVRRFRAWQIMGDRHRWGLPRVLHAAMPGMRGGVLVRRGGRVGQTYAVLAVGTAPQPAWKDRV
ncbi:hypothetical protein [Streptomyces sp. NPDC006435]|uniref:hypothetical protein n=1 Tax=Streptomyces sp. NPDC006435 TaxID=3154300 RepID=UPI0033A8A6D8